MASGRDDGGGSRQDRSRPHLPRGGVGSRVVGSICGRRQAASCARLPLHTAETGRDPWIRRAVTGGLPGPHANSVRYWSSPPLIRGLARALKRRTEGRQHRAGLSSYALQEKVRLGLRQCWSSRLSRPDVCEGSTAASPGPGEVCSVAVAARDPPATAGDAGGCPATAAAAVWDEQGVGSPCGWSPGARGGRVL